MALAGARLAVAAEVHVVVVGTVSLVLYSYSNVAMAVQAPGYVDVD